MVDQTLPISGGTISALCDTLALTRSLEDREGEEYLDLLVAHCSKTKRLFDLAASEPADPDRLLEGGSAAQGNGQFVGGDGDAAAYEDERPPLQLTAGHFEL